MATLKKELVEEITSTPWNTFLASLRDLPKDARVQLKTSIEDYSNGYTSLIVPITLLKHYSQLLEVDYLENQVYLKPHPKELALLVNL